LNKNVYILNMASRKVPTLFYDSRTLKVSFDKEKQTFYISAGLIIVGGKYFFFEGGEGELLPPPCRIGLEVKGKFKEDDNILWPKHGEDIKLQAFLNLRTQLSEEDLELALSEGSQGNSSEEKKECEAIKTQTLSPEKKSYPSSSKSVRFVSEIEEVIPTCLSLDSKTKNFKILATLIKENRFYQHQYGPMYFEPLYTKGKSPENIARIGFPSPECYKTEYINKDIVLI
jgi:hypothetical protein